MSPAQASDRVEESSPAPAKRSLRAELQRTIPPHITIFHYLGGLTLIFFSVQVVTGLLLMAYYRPSAEGAYESVRIITDEVCLGWLVRYLHRWGTDLLILLSLLHLLRVYFSRAYEAPRQLNWVAGVLLLVLIFSLAFTGILLPWDQYAYWYIDSARRAISGIPVVGNFLMSLFWGGWDLGEEVLLRFYGMHVGVLPCIALVALFIHAFMVWQFGIKEPKGRRRTADQAPPLFLPDLLLNLLIAALLVGGLLLSATVLFPPPLAEQANPVSPLVGARASWYLLPVHELLRDLPGGVAALVLFVLSLVVLLVPVLDRRPEPEKRERLMQRVLGVFLVAGWVLLGMRGFWR